jgi:hypothetical protein
LLARAERASISPTLLADRKNWRGAFLKTQGKRVLPH